jgi:hypothetical protein
MRALNNDWKIQSKAIGLAGRQGSSKILSHQYASYSYIGQIILALFDVSRGLTPPFFILIMTFFGR